MGTARHCAPRVDPILTRVEGSPPNLGGVPARTAKREPDRAKPQKKSEQAGGGSSAVTTSWGTTRPRFRSGKVEPSHVQPALQAAGTPAPFNQLRQQIMHRAEC